MGSRSSAAFFSDAGLSRQHLEAMLARIDVAVCREVLRWQLAGQDPADGFRGLHIPDDEARMLVARPFGTSWGQMVELDSEPAEALAEAAADATQQAEALADTAHAQGQVLPLEYLAQAFGLEPFDLDALLVCLAPALDLRYERLYAYLQDDVTHKRPSVNLVLDLLCGAGPDRLAFMTRFADDAPLFRHNLLEPLNRDEAERPSLLAQTLGVDRAVVSWLAGSYQPHPDLGPQTRWVLPQESAADRLLVGEARDELERALRLTDPVVVLYGPDWLRQEAAARCLGASAGRPLLMADLAAAAVLGVPPVRALHLALRDARLTAAIPCLSGWDTCLSAAGEGAARANTLATLVTQLCAHPGPVIVSGSQAWQATEVERERAFAWLELPGPGFEQRQALWAHYLATALPVQGEGGGEGQTGSFTASLDLSQVAGQFALTSVQIRDAVAGARDRAAHRGNSVRMEDLLASARAYSNPRLASLARKIEPRYTWADIILPDDQLALLREIVTAVRERPLVLEAWGVGRKLARSSGVPILFAGPPGTGKTMAAEIIAGELGLDLYKIDLSTVVSKYIGETEKNLERIFSEAQSSNAILFFDEADAIFGKRSEVRDAHDRYANVEISYLLQRMEVYEGVTILATNLRANLDEAFTRRLQFAIDFPFPEEEYRLRIWQTLFPPGVPRAPDLDFELLASRFRLAGGNIRNVIVSAAYLAAADGRLVTMEHLLHGVRRELQKMGRLVKQKDMVFLGG